MRCPLLSWLALSCLLLSYLPLNVEADLTATIDEELPIDSVVTTIPPHVYNNLNPEHVMVAILNQKTPPASYFKIDQSTRTISVARRIDREEICDRRYHCQVQFNIAIQSLSQESSAFSNIETVKVIINDINDHTPTFPAREVTLEISEVAKVGTELKISGAVDRDAVPEFQVQSYNMAPVVAIFSIHPTSHPDGSSTINLRLERELDRETAESFTFNLVAYDGGSRPKSDFLKVKVMVTDENDNTPVFDSLKYQWTVPETEPVGAVVGQVRALDKDGGYFGTVKYQFSLATPPAIKTLLTLNETSGEVKVAGDLRQARRSGPLLVYVDAKDGGYPPRVSQTQVVVDIKKSGNDPPKVKVNTVLAGDATVVSIPEAAVIDFFVAFIDVDDDDEGGAGEADCRLLSGNEFKLKPVARKGYTLLVNRPVDREKRDSYVIVISCLDRAPHPLETQVSLTVNLTDANDNAPVFQQQVYNAKVMENVQDQFVIQVSAKDADIGMNAEVLYSLPQGVGGYLKIHPRSGIITTTNKLDREKNHSLSFEVFAADKGDKPNTGTAQVLITVADVNDNAPQFNVSTFNFSVSEWSANNSWVGQLSAHDADSGRNGEFYFYSNSDATLPFHVSKNGSIFLIGQVDREVKDTYSFVVLVSDYGDNPQTSSASVDIKIYDENDNEPLFLFPTSKNHTVLISNFPETGTLLGRVIAYDLDQGEFANLRYTISEGNEKGFFTIDQITGEIKLHKTESLGNPADYLLSISVSDVSKTPRNSTTQLKIEVNFANSTETPEDKRDHYVVIVGVIAGATCLLSIIIVSAILVLLRSDMRRHARTGSLFKNKFIQGCGQTVPVDTTLVTAFNDCNLPKETKEENYSPVKKSFDQQKKVSFNVKDNLEDSSDSRQVKSLGDKTIYQPNCSDDSDASLESVTSDSGRGASDDDIRTNMTSGSLLEVARQYNSNKVKGHSTHMSAPDIHNDAPVHSYNGRLHTTSPGMSTFKSGPPYGTHLMNNSFPRHSRGKIHTTPPRRPPHVLSTLIDEETASSTSGSYTLNHDDVVLDEMMRRDLVV